MARKKKRSKASYRKAGLKAARTRRRNKAKRSRVAKKGGKRKAHIGYCTRGGCARRPIFGGAKGMATHIRRHHKSRR